MRSAVRSLFLSKAFAATAVLSLALGIGANTAIFSLVNALLLRPLPVPNPDRLAQLYTDGPGGRSGQSFSWSTYEQIRDIPGIFSNAFASLNGALENFEVNGVKYGSGLDAVGGEYFPTLGVKPLLGRLIASSDVTTRAQVAVISYRCWQERYAKDAHVIGKTILIGGRAMTIIGVTPRAFDGIIIDYAFEAAVPITWRNIANPNDPTQTHFVVLGRLNPGVSLTQARTAVQTRWPSIQRATLPDRYRGSQAAAFLARRIGLESAATGTSYLRTRQSHALLVIMVLVGAVLLIACVNLSTLMLSRATVKQHETAIRTALGASQWQLLRHWMAESLILSFAGAALGLVSAFWTTRFLLNLNTAGFSAMALDPTPDFRVLAFTCAVTLVAALLFGAAPAFTGARINPSATMQRHSLRFHGRRGLGARLLVGAQIALSMVLVSGAALLVRSLENMRTADLGFRRDHILVMQLFGQAGRERIPNRTAYYRDLVEKLRQLAGVQSVTYSHLGPVSRAEYPLRVEAGAVSSNAIVEVAGPGLFNMLGMHVLHGRQFDWRDDSLAPRAAVISESLAREMFPGQEAIGRTLDIPEFPASRIPIVGIVNSASLWLPRHREPAAVYLSFLQEPDYNQPLLLIRTYGNPLSLAHSAESVVESLGHHYSLRTQTLDQRADLFLSEDRITVTLSASFAMLALLLAGVGLYGVVSHAVARRVPEIGVRMAVGADQSNVMGLIMRDVLWLLSAGLAIGVPATFAVRRLIGSLLFGIAPNDPGTLAGSAAVLIAVALVAGLLPTLRAMRIDPMNALRSE